MAIMGIFRQNEHFSRVLVVWDARFQALVVRRAIRRMAGSFGGLNCIFFLFCSKENHGWWTRKPF
jgi:hypothetical protein